MTDLASPAALTPLQQLLDYGGPVMLVIIALAAVALIAFVYTILVGVAFAPRSSRTLKHAIQSWDQNPSRSAPEVIRKNSGWWSRLNPLAGLVAHTMTSRLDRVDDTTLREDIARLAHRALVPFEAPLKIIEVVAALAPLLGLLGTVMGMMEAFSAMSASEGRASATQLSGGIYEALSTTAAGLVVAIPTAAIAAWLEFRLRRLNTHMNDMLVSVLRVAIPEPANPTSPSQVPENDTETESAPAFTEGRRLAHATG